jgi:hypothetical protein
LSTRDFIRNDFVNTVSIPKDIRIPEAKDAISSRFKPLITANIIFVLVMLTAVYFNYQLKFVTHKIDDVLTDWRLPSKADSIEAMRAKQIPKAPFRFSHLVAQRFCSCAIDLRRSAMVRGMPTPLPDRFAVRPPPQGGR